MASLGQMIHALECRTLLSGDFSSLLTLGTPETVQAVVSIDHDAAGNTYLAGTFEGNLDFAPGSAVKTASSKNQAVYIAKYTPAGKLVWVRTLSSQRDLQISQMKVDDAGDVYFAGPFGSTMDLDPSAATFNVRSNGEDDIYIAKLNSAGQFQWGGSIGGSFNDTIAALNVTPGGQVYFGGEYVIRADLDPSPGATTVVEGNDTSNVYLIKLNADGTLGYRRTLSGDADKSFFVRIENMAVGADGAIALSGMWKGKIDFDPSANVVQKHSDGVERFVLRLNSAGNFQWVDTYGRNGKLSLRSMNMDAGGNIYLAGQFTDSPDFDPGSRVLTLESVSQGKGIYSGDIFLQKLAPNGKLAWVRQIGSSDVSLQLMDMDIDAAGNPVITGGFQGTVDFDPGAGQRIFDNQSNENNKLPISITDGSNGFIEKFTSAGKFAWVRRIGDDDSIAIGTAVSIDPAGNIHAGGIFAHSVDFNPGPGRAIRTADDKGEVYVLKLTA